MPRTRITRKRLNYALCVDSDDDFGELHNRKTQKRKSNPKTKNTNIAKNINNSVIILDDSDDECLSTVISRTRKLEENVSKKVDSFFQTSGLISDDEDDITLQNVTTNTTNISSQGRSKDISTSSAINNKSNKEQVTVSDEETDDKCILEDIKNYCAETEDLLKNANALLDKFIRTNSQEEQKVTDQKSPTNENKTVKEKQPQEKGLGECPVCYENFAEKQVMTTKCGHLFCKVCIEKIATTIRKCPTCRKAVNKRNIIAIYI